jgi:hypothetical protein
VAIDKINIGKKAIALFAQAISWKFLVKTDWRVIKSDQSHLIPTNTHEPDHLPIPFCHSMSMSLHHNKGKKTPEDASTFRNQTCNQKVMTFEETNCGKDGGIPTSFADRGPACSENFANLAEERSKRAELSCQGSVENGGLGYAMLKIRSADAMNP